MSQTSVPKFVVSPVNVDKDWDELMRVFWDSWKTPFQASGQLTFPNLGANNPAEEAAFEETKLYLLDDARKNKDSLYWYKCTDTVTGIIVGGACFKHEKDWPINAGNFTGCGFEPGSEMQDLSDSFYRQLLAWRTQIMRGEHAYGRSIFLLPGSRSQEAGKLLMHAGLQQIDKLGLETFLEGTSLSTPGLLGVGFIVITWTNMVFRRENPSAHWKRLVHNIQSHPISILWRPRLGRYIEGETILPWTGKPREAKL